MRGLILGGSRSGANDRGIGGFPGLWGGAILAFLVKSSEELLLSSRAGDEAAIGELIQRHLPALRGGRSVRRQLRGVRFYLFDRRTTEPQVHPVGYNTRQARL